jgi:hypothetical protein
MYSRCNNNAKSKYATTMQSKLFHQCDGILPMQQLILSLMTLKLIQCTAQIGTLLTELVKSNRKKYLTTPKYFIPMHVK